MSILQEFDSVMYYENIEKFWKKYRIVLLGALIGVFGATAGINYYNQKVIEKSQHDSDIIIKLMTKQQVTPVGKQKEIQSALKEVFSTKAKDALTLELAKEYKKEGNDKLFENTLLSLQDSKNVLLKDISSYMLAEYYLGTDAKKAIEFIDSVEITSTSFNYAMIQDIKAMALISLDKKDEAKQVYLSLLQDKTLPQNVNTKITTKLGQIK